MENQSLIPIVPVVEAVDCQKIREYSKNQVYNPHVPTHEKIEEIIVRSIYIRYELWNQKSKLFYIPAVADIYEYLTLNKYFRVTNEEKNMYFDKAIKYLQNNKTKRGNHSIGEILSRDIVPETIDKETVIRYAKLFVIEAFFQSIKDSGKDITEVVVCKKNINPLGQL